MKQQFLYSKNKRKTLVFIRLALFSLTFIFFVVLAKAQTPPSASEIKTSANLLISPTPPQTNSEQTINNISKKPEITETENLSLVENLIYSGDILEIDVLGSLDYDWNGKTDDEGFLSSLPSLDVSIFALCRTEDELAAQIGAAYSKLIKNPRVSVRIIDRSARQPAILFGAVRLPQKFQIRRAVRLNELVITSGGITEDASGEISILRPAHAACAAHNQDQTTSQFIEIKLADLIGGKPEANPIVRPGDVVTVNEAPPIYVTGGVALNQRILFREGLTVSRAIASAGGLNHNADQNKIFIYRRQKDRPDLQIIEADLKKIINQQAEDVPLKAYDIVEVSQNGRTRNNRPPVVTTLVTEQFDINKLPVRSID